MYLFIRECLIPVVKGLTQNISKVTNVKKESIAIPVSK